MVAWCSSNGLMTCISRLRRRLRIISRCCSFRQEVEWITVSIELLGLSYLSPYTVTLSCRAKRLRRKSLIEFKRRKVTISVMIQRGFNDRNCSRRCVLRRRYLLESRKLWMSALKRASIVGGPEIGNGELYGVRSEVLPGSRTTGNTENVIDGVEHNGDTPDQPGLIKLWPTCFTSCICVLFDLPGSNIETEMIIVDQQGSAIHAGIKGTTINKFKVIIHEGDIYEISNFLIESVDQFCPVSRRIKLRILPSTVVKQVDQEIFQIPMTYFEFPSYAELEQRVGKKEQLSDIVGMLTGVGEVREILVENKLVKIRNLRIRLPENKVVLMTLWRTVAVDFKDPLAEGILEPFVIVMTSSRVNLYNGGIALSGTPSTQALRDVDIPETRDAKERLMGMDKEIKWIGVTGQAKQNLETRMNDNRRTLKEIMEYRLRLGEELRIFSVHAKIRGVADMINWHYSGCNNCSKKVIDAGKNTFCENCGVNPCTPITRFRLQLNVVDPSGTAIFTLFDNEAYVLLGAIAHELVAEGQVVRFGTPEKFRNLIGRSLLFEIKITDYNMSSKSNNFTVTQVFIPPTMDQGGPSNTDPKEETIDVKDDLKSPSSQPVICLTPEKEEKGKNVVTPDLPNRESSQDVARLERSSVKDPKIRRQVVLSSDDDEPVPFKGNDSAPNYKRLKKHVVDGEQPSLASLPNNIVVKIEPIEDDEAGNCSGHKATAKILNDSEGSDDEFSHRP